MAKPLNIESKIGGLIPISDFFKLVVIIVFDFFALMVLMPRLGGKLTFIVCLGVLAFFTLFFILKSLLPEKFIFNYISYKSTAQIFIPKREKPEVDLGQD